MTSYYPPVSFYFKLDFVGIATAVDNGFQEASGFSVELKTEEIQEGGLNIYAHKVPSVANYSNLVLRRGFVHAESALAVWFQKTLRSDFTEPIDPRNIMLSLLGATGEPLVTWTFHRAWPVKWSVSDFKAQENSIAIETIEFSYAWFDK